MVGAGPGPGAAGDGVVSSPGVGVSGGEVSDVGDSGVVGVPGSVVVVVVVGVVVSTVVLGRSRTLVRGTQVYSGSGTNPGGTTCVAGASGVGGDGW